MVVVDQDKQDSMMAEKYFHNPVGSENSKPGDLLAQKEDEIVPLRRVRSRSRRQIHIRPMGRIRLLSLRTLGGVWDVAHIRLSIRWSGRNKI
jgi:hypothetical protein